MRTEPTRPVPGGAREDPIGAERPSRRLRLGSVPLVGLAVLFTIALRVPYLNRPLLPDEAGLLLIAQSWSEGPYLYGDYFVGRGIVLVLFYGLGDLLGGAVGVRILAALVASLMVVSAAWAGHQLRGRAGAGWAALVAAAYSSTYALSSEGMNGRLLAAAFVMTSCALTLAAVRRSGTGAAVRRSGIGAAVRRSGTGAREPRTADASTGVAPDVGRTGGVPDRGAAFRFAVGAGVLASLPVLVVQSYVDGWVFAAVVLVVAVRANLLAGVDALRVVLGGIVGLLVVTGALLVGIAATWLTLEQLWFQLVGYRVDASLAVVESTDAPGERLLMLLVLASYTGMLLLLAGHFSALRSLRSAPLLLSTWCGVVGMLLLTVASMVAGGDWWPDYLLQAIPALALAAALVAPGSSWSSWVARIGACLAAFAAVWWQYLGINDPVLGTPTNEAAVGTWIAEAGHSDDTAVVIWGKANVLHAADMTSPYPFLWSLVMRTLDPELDEMVDLLAGPEAPTWVVIWHDPDSWDLDEDGRLSATLAERYEQVGTPCGIDVLLLKGEDRDVLPDDACGPW